jgi:hypothetical protein
MMLTKSASLEKVEVQAEVEDQEHVESFLNLDLDLSFLKSTLPCTSN